MAKAARREPGAWAALGEGTNRRALLAVLFDTFFMWGGFFMVIPLISVHYVDRLGWAAASIGLVLALRQLTQQGLSPLSGMLADRLGPKGLICCGLFLRVIAFSVMAFATTFPLLLLSCMLAALGGSLFDAPKAAAIAALTTPENRARFYSLSGVVSNLGVTLGTQAGALLLGFDFAFVAFGAAFCFLICFLITLIFLPPVRIAQESATMTAGFRLALRDRPFMAFNALLMGFWVLWVQMSISLPLVATALAGSDAAVSWVYGINAGMNVLLQYPLLRLAERRLSPAMILALGVGTMGVGLGAVALAGSIGVLLLAVVIISAGGLLAMPSQQTVTAGLSNPIALGSYFGVNSLALAVGGGLGNLSGGLLYDIGNHVGVPALPWLTFAAVGLLTAVGLGLMFAGRSKRVAEPLVPVET